jgi:uncharacterized C2H2 Zn-finger protein
MNDLKDLKLGLFNWRHDKEEKAENRLFKCKHCGTTFDDKEKLKKHNEKAHTGKGKK